LRWAKSLPSMMRPTYTLRPSCRRTYGTATTLSIERDTPASHEMETLTETWPGGPSAMRDATTSRTCERSTTSLRSNTFSTPRDTMTRGFGRSLSDLVMQRLPGSALAADDSKDITSASKSRAWNFGDGLAIAFRRACARSEGCMRSKRIEANTSSSSVWRSESALIQASIRNGQHK
jgi:hypothetical protein